MNSTLCFKMAFKFKLFTIDIPIFDPCEIFFCFLFDSSCTARHLLVRALPNSSILIHCIPSVTWDTRVEVGFLVGLKFFKR